MHKKNWGKIAVVLSFTALALGCQPRDVDPRFGTVEAGKVGSVVSDFRDVDSPSKDFNFNTTYIETKDQPGQQLSSCTSGAWTDIRMYDRSNKDRIYKSIYTGDRVAVLGPAMNCQKVGMRVLITSSSEKGANYGHAVVTKLMLVDKNNLTSEMLSALDHTKSSVEAMLKTSQTASILVFKYVKGSSPQEEKFLSIPDPQAEVGNAVGNVVSNFLEIQSPSKTIEVVNAKESKVNIGEKLSSCKGGNWTDIRIYDKFSKDIYKLIYSGERVAMLAFPNNCHTVGMRIKIGSQTEGKDSHYGEAVVTGLYLIDKENLTEDFLKEVDHTPKSIENYLKTEPTASVITFKYVKGSAAQEAEFLNGFVPAVTPPAEEKPATETPATGTNTGVNVVPGNSGGIHIFIEGNPSEPITITINPGSGVIAPRVDVVGAATGTNTGGVVSATPAPVEIAVQTRKQIIEQTGEDLEVVEYSNRKNLLSTCKFNSAWSSYRSFRKLDAKLYAGELVSRIGKGTLNCYEPTSVIDIEGEVGQPTRGQIRIKEVFVMQTKDLTDALIATTGQTRAELQDYLADSQFVNITIFEYVQGSAEQASAGATGPATEIEGEIAFKPGQVLKSCSASQSDILNLNQDDFDKFNLSSHKKAFALPKAPCTAVGTFASLNLAGQSVLKDQVKVIRVELKNVADVDESDLEQLGFSDQAQFLVGLTQDWQRAVTETDQIAIVYVRN